MPEYSITFFKTTFRPTKGGRLNTIRARDFIPSFPSMVRSSRTKKKSPRNTGFIWNHTPNAPNRY